MKPITAHPVKISRYDWGLRFEVECPIPVDERKKSGGTASKAFQEWIEAFRGREMTVVSKSGKTWSNRCGSIIAFNGFGDTVTITAFSTRR